MSESIDILLFQLLYIISCIIWQEYFSAIFQNLHELIEIDNSRVCSTFPLSFCHFDIYIIFIIFEPSIHIHNTFINCSKPSSLKSPTSSFTTKQRSHSLINRKVHHKSYEENIVNIACVGNKTKREWMNGWMKCWPYF